jgi:hypothetical protein
VVVFGWGELQICMALFYCYLFRVLCVVSILSSCLGDRLKGSDGIREGIVESARESFERRRRLWGRQLIVFVSVQWSVKTAQQRIRIRSQVRWVDGLRVVGRVLFHKVIRHQHHIVVHVGSRSSIIDGLKVGGHVGHGYRVETLHGCVWV